MANDQQLETRRKKSEATRKANEEQFRKFNEATAKSGDAKAIANLQKEGYQVTQTREGTTIRTSVKSPAQIRLEQQKQIQQKREEQQIKTAYHVRLSDKLRISDDVKRNEPTKPSYEIKKSGRPLTEKEQGPNEPETVGIAGTIANPVQLVRESERKEETEWKEGDVIPASEVDKISLSPSQEKTIDDLESKQKTTKIPINAGLMIHPETMKMIANQFEFNKPVEERSPTNQRIAGALAGTQDFIDESENFLKSTYKSITGQKDGLVSGDEARKASGKNILGTDANPLGLPVPKTQIQPRSKLISDISQGKPVDLNKPFTQGEVIGLTGEFLTALIGIRKGVRFGAKKQDEKIITSGKSEAETVKDVLTTDKKNQIGVGRKGEKVEVETITERSPSKLESPEAGKNDPTRFIVEQGTESNIQPFPTSIITTTKQGKGITTTYSSPQIAESIKLESVSNVKFKGKLPKDLEDQLTGIGLEPTKESINLSKIEQIGKSNYYEIKNPTKTQLEILQQAQETGAIKPFAVGQNIPTQFLERYSDAGRRFSKNPSKGTIPETPIISQEIIYDVRQVSKSQNYRVDINTIGTETKTGKTKVEGIGRKGEKVEVEKEFQYEIDQDDINVINEKGFKDFDAELKPYSKIQNADELYSKIKDPTDFSSTEINLGKGKRPSPIDNGKKTSGQQTKTIKDESQEIKEVIREIEKAYGTEYQKSSSSKPTGILPIPQTDYSYGSSEVFETQEVYQGPIQKTEPSFSFKEISYSDAITGIKQSPQTKIQESVSQSMKQAQEPIVDFVEITKTVLSPRQEQKPKEDYSPRVDVITRPAIQQKQDSSTIQTQITEIVNPPIQTPILTPPEYPPELIPPKNPPISPLFPNYGFPEDEYPKKRPLGKEYLVYGVDPNRVLGFSSKGADALAVSRSKKIFDNDPFLKEFKAGKGEDINKAYNRSKKDNPFKGSFNGKLTRNGAFYSFEPNEISYELPNTKKKSTSKKKRSTPKKKKKSIPKKSKRKSTKQTKRKTAKRDNSFAFQGTA